MTRRILAALALAACSQCALADITIASWNIQRLGHENQKSFEQLAIVASQADFLAVQEVMTSAATTKLEQSLEAETGESWSVLESDAVGRGSYKESYAFLWRDSKVSYEDGAVSYLDRHDTFEREPFSAQFKEVETGKLFVAATVHILYGKGPQDRTPEIRELANYWQWLGEVYPGNPNRFLMGDFNMPPGDPAWRELKAYARPLIQKGASTLSERDGKFKNLYDNIFVPTSGGPNVRQALILNYPRLIGWSHKKSRKHISDHAPVFIQAELSEGRNELQAARPAIKATNALAKNEMRTASNSGALAGDDGVRGNLKSKVFHREKCPSYNSVGLRNRVEFESPSAAIAAGYRLAGNCK